jgi:hypothetical protein
MAASFSFINSFSTKQLTLKIYSAAQAEAKRSKHISGTSVGLRVRQDCGFERFVSYLNVAEFIYIYTFNPIL